MIDNFSTIPYAYAQTGIRGMSICTTAPFAEAYEIVLNLVKLLAIAILFVVVLGILISLFMAKSITTPFVWIAEQTGALAHGDTNLTERKMGYSSTKEMVELKQSVGFLASSLESMLSKLDLESKNMLHTVDTIASQVSESNASANDTSATMEELSAAMQEVSATMENINRSTEVTADTILEIARYYREDSTHLEGVLSEFASQAGDLRENTNILKDGMNGIATAVEESTKGIVMVAESTSDLVTNLGSIQKEVVDNKRISNELRQEVDKFR